MLVKNRKRGRFHAGPRISDRLEIGRDYPRRRVILFYQGGWIITQLTDLISNLTLMRLFEGLTIRSY